MGIPRIGGGFFVQSNFAQLLGPTSKFLTGTSDDFNELDLELQGAVGCFVCVCVCFHILYSVYIIYYVYYICVFVNVIY